MNRRDFLHQLGSFCTAYGIQGILSPNSFAAEPVNKLVNFVIKYTGGGTVSGGIGQWTTGNFLKPLAPYIGDMTFPIGLSCKFNAPMNSHAAPQVSALSGAMTGFVKRETYYPLGNLKNFSSGQGKSMDVLVGEHLQNKYKTKLPYLLLSNNNITRQLACTHRTSSWGKGGEVLPAYQTINTLSAAVANEIFCSEHKKAFYQQQLTALAYIKRNKKIFTSNYLIDKEKMEKVELHLAKISADYNTGLEMFAKQATIPEVCGKFPEKEFNSSLSVSDDTVRHEKMDLMYDSAIAALKYDVTRVITVNLYSSKTHATSHFPTSNGASAYYDASRVLQKSIASFLAKLKSANLYDETMIFCNAGSCMSAQGHNFENLSTYVINGGRPGIRGRVNRPYPIGSLLLEIMQKFGLNYTTYGGTDHVNGVGKFVRYL